MRYTNKEILMKGLRYITVAIGELIHHNQEWMTIKQRRKLTKMIDTIEYNMETFGEEA